MHTKPENWEKLQDREYRHALAAAQFKRFVPFQISALRRQGPWSQQELADRAGVTQGVISRAEDPDNGNLTVNTILRIANGLDRVFVGRFVSYSEFEDWRRSLSEDTVVLDFQQEDAEFEEEHRRIKLEIKPSFKRQPRHRLSVRVTSRGDRAALVNRCLVPQRAAAQMPLPFGDLRFVSDATRLATVIAFPKHHGSAVNGSQLGALSAAVGGGIYGR